MTRLFSISMSVFLLASCTSSRPNLFSRQSPHEVYGKKLSSAGLEGTILGNQWFLQAQNALQQPLPITLPFKQTGYFSADKPRAIGLGFSALRGSKLLFRIDNAPSGRFVLYADLWLVKTGGKPELLISSDTSLPAFEYTIQESQSYILRLQPELLGSGQYTLSVTVAPSLKFPVAGKSARVGSVWGDDRSGGARKHEGIDIFAPKRTPVVAAFAGTINRVDETPIGGKVVWLRPKGMNLNLYYAHLDQQLVVSGQSVLPGDTLGLVGNTGNALSTPPHLHFGIYALGGAVDPLPYVTAAKQPSQTKLALPTTRLWRTIRDLTLNGERIQKFTPVLVSDISEGSIVGSLPDGRVYSFSDKTLQPIDNQLTTKTIQDSALILDQPSIQAAVKRMYFSKTQVSVLGYYNEHSLVETPDGEKGWIGSGK
ncbi:MAG: M23 family metallopeptidase [Chitinophagaceae bacterium]